MSLVVQQGMLKIDGDTRGATRALEQLRKQQENVVGGVKKAGNSFTDFLTNAINPTTIALGMASTAFAVTVSAIKDLIDASKEAADLWSQFGENADSMVHIAEGLQYAADGMIKLQTASTVYNRLARSELGATYNQVEAITKMAVELGRKFGENADEIANRLSEAFSKGEFEELKKYGLYLDKNAVKADAIKNLMERGVTDLTEQNIKLETSRIALESIEKKYKNIAITASDISEIEAKTKNEREKNRLITAKIEENTANALTQVKRFMEAGWDASKQLITGGGLQYETIGFNAIRTATAVAESYKTLAIANKTIIDIFQLDSKNLNNTFLDINELSERLEYKVSSLKETAEKAYKLDDSKLTENIDYYSKLSGKLENTIKGFKILRDVLQSLGQDTGYFDNLIKKIVTLKIGVENTLQTMEDEKAVRTFRDSIRNVSSSIKENQAIILAYDPKTLKGVYDVNYLNNAHRILQNIYKVNEDKIRQFETFISSGARLSATELATYEAMKKQNEEIKARNRLITTLVANLLGLQVTEEKQVNKNRQPSAYEQELEQARKLYKKDKDLVLEYYKASSFDDVKKEIKKRYDEEEQYREKLSSEVNERRKKELEEEKKQMKEYEEEMAKVIANKLKAEYTIMESELDKVFSSYAKTKRTLDRKLRYGDLSESEKDKLEMKMLDDEVERYQKELDIVNESIKNISEIKDADVKELDDANKKKIDLEQKLLDAKEKIADKEAEIEKRRRDRIKQITENAYRDIKGMGESLFKETSQNMYDALTMSDEAVKKSYMTRGEILRKALKEELQTISKKAFVQSLWELAQSAAAYATGNVAGAAAHAKAAGAYALVSGVALGASNAVGAPSESEIERRKSAAEGKKQLENSKAGVEGATSAQQITYQIYFPNGLLIGDAESVTKVINKTTKELARRGKL